MDFSALVASPERMQKHADFIQRRVAKSTMFNKYGLTHTESNEVIIDSMMGELRNTVLAFFKGKDSGFTEKRCDACKTTDPAMQYDRAHDRGVNRKQVALNALQRCRPDETVPIKQKDVIKAFVLEHANVPLWYLCKECHRKYDSKTMTHEDAPPIPAA